MAEIAGNPFSILIAPLSVYYIFLGTRNIDLFPKLPQHFESTKPTSITHLEIILEGSCFEPTLQFHMTRIEPIAVVRREVSGESLPLLDG
jgi:hypothetical protein